MKKNDLIGFINRYYLGGNVEACAWVFSNGELETQFRTSDKTLMGKLIKKNIGVDDTCTIGVLTTAQLLRFANSIDTAEFTLAFDRYTVGDEEKIIKLVLSDGSSIKNYALADLTVIPKAKGIKNEPEYDLVIDIDDSFINSFLKNKTTLPDAKTFTILKDDRTNKMRIIIGYSTTNNDNVFIDNFVSDIVSEFNKPISFSADYFKEILLANRGASEFKLFISSAGLAYIKVQSGDYFADYYLAEAQTDV